MPISLIQKLKNNISKKKSDRILRRRENLTRDHIDINLWGLSMSVTRETNLDIPSELSVILPRVEYRRNCTSNDSPLCDFEVIYSSLTVVIAPRHPLAAPSPETALQRDKRNSPN